MDIVAVQTLESVADTARSAADTAAEYLDRVQELILGARAALGEFAGKEHGA